MNDNILNIKGVTKHFGGVTALSNVDLDLQRGEILALVGENGAGKSTLMKILSGIYQKDSGEILLNGSPVCIRNTKHSKLLGIRIIYQELAIANELTVMENIFLGSIPSLLGMVKWKTMRKRAKEILHDFGIVVSPDTMAGELSVAYQQHIEIIKALVCESKILILDEPTAVLSQKDVERLFVIIRQMKACGVSIIYISHRMDEIFQISDRIAVLKDGFSMGNLNTKVATREEVITRMIGRELGDLYPDKSKKNIGKDLLTVEGLSLNNKLKNISFSVRRGEIFGLAGLVGSGRSRLVKVICGLEKMNKGNIYLNGIKINNDNLGQAIQNRFGLVPENRKEQGLFISLSVLENTTIGIRKKISNFMGFIIRKKEFLYAKKALKEFSTKYGKLRHPVDSLSGGNQQKVAIAKWSLVDPEIFIFDEPTRGVDVGAKVEIYQLIVRMAEQGKAIVVISSELPEIIGICDRVGIMSRGELVTTLDRDELSEHRILSFAV